VTESLTIGTQLLAYDLMGEGPLVVLAHGIGDSRHSYRFLAPALAAAGYRVANVDIRGCGDSSTGWDGYSRTDIAGDLIALVRELGGPAVIVGQSISGGAATIAAATAPEAISGLVELAPFTRAVSYPIGGMLRVRRYRRGSVFLMRTLLVGSLPALTLPFLGNVLPRA
jgi:pimeloyl-ACP methyl ester carboxylesterase